MSITLYELVGRDDLRFSPYCWRTRFALAHKGLEFDYRPPSALPDKQPIAFSGQERVPVLRDEGPDGERIRGRSPAISMKPIPTSRRSSRAPRSARWRDSSIPGPISRLTRASSCWWSGTSTTISTNATANISWRPREKRFGTTLDALHEARDERLPAARAALAPVRAVLDDQPYIAGDEPGYADYILMGTCQWNPHRQPLPDHRARRSGPRVARTHARAVRRNGGRYPGARPLKQVPRRVRPGNGMNDHASHILVVDDDDRLRDLLKQYLAGNGYRVTDAGDAARSSGEAPRHGVRSHRPRRDDAGRGRACR